MYILFIPMIKNLKSWTNESSANQASVERLRNQSISWHDDFARDQLMASIITWSL